MDNLEAIRLFVEAAQLGGLSAAGRKLGLSPAAASARLLKLEACWPLACSSAPPASCG